ncbi:hypothetical protein SD72_09945 [Leucobacter komagatae]|uniref:Uncharacterized protein n=1 Tax=Leucobacter komagatae TaxID=55969 RepID=A0A0D0HXK6_9MICO|nr:hypothetical protein SD72_09945 [Leucobacter komagatae]
MRWSLAGLLREGRGDGRRARLPGRIEGLSLLSGLSGLSGLSRLNGLSGVSRLNGAGLLSLLSGVNRRGRHLPRYLPRRLPRHLGRCLARCLRVSLPWCVRGSPRWRLPVEALQLVLRELARGLCGIRH